ncbi:MAG: winged helix-turn-helix transcriptional regulator [Fimbriimonadaceae bacterium]|nr:winged helix-turn-helix transcriptional regulator [Fimbriimonadaceae bacterium]
MASDSLSLVFSALADPTRRAILEQLAGGPRSVGDIASEFTMTGPAITKHLRVLEKAGLIRQEKQAQLRPRTLQAKPLKEAQAWIEDYRQFWEQSFDRLDAYLNELQRTSKESAEGKKDQETQP